MEGTLTSVTPFTPFNERQASSQSMDLTINTNKFKHAASKKFKFILPKINKLSGENAPTNRQPSKSMQILTPLSGRGNKLGASKPYE